MKNVTLRYEGGEIELPVIKGSEGERAIDISTLRAQTGLVTLDQGYGNTGSCTSDITFIDGKKGILRYRGYDIQDLTNYRFSEICHLLIYGKLPSASEWQSFKEKLVHYTMLHEDMKKLFEGFMPSSHPMVILSAMIASLSAYYPATEEEADNNIIRLLAKAKTIAAFSYRKSRGKPFIYPRSELSYAANFLRMMFSSPVEDYDPPRVIEDAINLLLILHADHEQNCSTSTVRMVGSAGTNLFASVSAGISALWGPLHGGANQAVIEMLESLQQNKMSVKDFVARVKDKQNSIKLMGFGHRVYKQYDPRASVLKATAKRLLDELGSDDHLLHLANDLEEVALKDEFFVSRNLYPNVDFYSGIIYRAIGIPVNMFTVMFALGRLPGWIAHWLEMRNDAGTKIYRPRQVYTGHTKRSASK